MDKITVLLVDDHAMVRQGIKAFLQTKKEIEIVGETDDGNEAAEFCAENAPDVVLLDLIMPKLGGLEATRLIQKASPATKIIILTSHHDDRLILPAIKAGASSYLLKDVDSKELIEAVRRAARGETSLNPQIAAQLIKSLQNFDSENDEGGVLTTLSKRELEVIRLIAEGLSNAKISEKLFISEKTVKTHVSNILSKLHLADRTQAAVFAWREGLVSKN